MRKSETATTTKFLPKKLRFDNAALETKTESFQFFLVEVYRIFSRWPLTCCLQTVLKLWKVKCLVVRFLRAAAAALITLTPFLLRLHLLFRQQAQAGLPVAASYLQPRPTCNPTKAQAAKGKRNNVTPQPFKKNSSSEKHL